MLNPGHSYNIDTSDACAFVWPLWARLLGSGSLHQTAESNTELSSAEATFCTRFFLILVEAAW